MARRVHPYSSIAVASEVALYEVTRWLVCVRLTIDSTGVWRRRNAKVAVRIGSVLNYPQIRTVCCLWQRAAIRRVPVTVGRSNLYSRTSRSNLGAALGSCIVPTISSAYTNYSNSFGERFSDVWSELRNCFAARALVFRRNGPVSCDRLLYYSRETSRRRSGWIGVQFAVS